MDGIGFINGHFFQNDCIDYTLVSREFKEQNPGMSGRALRKNQALRKGIFKQEATGLPS